MKQYNLPRSTSRYPIGLWKNQSCWRFATCFRFHFFVTLPGRTITYIYISSAQNAHIRFSVNGKSPIGYRKTCILPRLSVDKVSKFISIGIFKVRQYRHGWDNEESFMWLLFFCVHSYVLSEVLQQEQLTLAVLVSSHRGHYLGLWT